MGDIYQTQRFISDLKYLENRNSAQYKKIYPEENEKLVVCRLTFYASVLSIYI